MIYRVISIFAWCAVGLGCSSEEWTQKEVGDSGVSISFPQEVIFQENSRSLEDNGDSFYSTLTGKIDENTSYFIAILQLIDTAEKEIIELIKEEYSNQNCGKDIRIDLGAEISFVSKEITEVAGTKSFLIRCAINRNGINGLEEIYLIPNNNQLITLSITYPIDNANIQPHKFLSSLELAK